MRRRVNRLMGGGRTVAFQAYSAPDGTEVGSTPTESGHSWQNPSNLSAVEGSRATIQSGRLIARADSASNTISYLTVHRGRRNGKVSADIVRTAAATNTNIGLLIRHSRDRGYAALYAPASAVWQLFRRHPVTGNTQLGSNIAQSQTQDQVYRVSWEAYGQVLVLRIDGTIVGRAEDPYIPRGAAGFRIGTNVIVAPSNVMDNWMATR